MPTQGHLVVVQLTVLRAGGVALRDVELVQAHVFVPSALAAARAGRRPVRTGASLAADQEEQPATFVPEPVEGVDELDEEPPQQVPAKETEAVARPLEEHVEGGAEPLAVVNSRG